MNLRAILARLALIVALAGPAGAEQAADPAAAATETPGEIALSLAADGTLTVTGVLPPGLSSDALAAALRGVELSGIDQADPGAPAEWWPALDALSIVLPRFRTATVRMAQGRLAIAGELKTGLSAVGAEAALRSALGTGWRLELDLAETPPPAEIVVARSEEGVAVSGLLPAGLAPLEALELLGAADAGLAGGGEGDAEAWSEVLAALGGTLDLFASATAHISADRVAVDGVLRPGYPGPSVAERLGAKLPAGWTSSLDADETPPGEGDRRLSLGTEQPESFRRGFWLPDVGFPVSATRCRIEADAALAGGGLDEGLPFAAGTAQIENRGLPLVNRLAAIAVRCLNSSSLRLEIAGHTDSVGNDARNEALSFARAEAVRQALVDRGVRAEAVTARGYGESRPLTTNNTPDGRALNRRVVFEWSAPES